MIFLMCAWALCAWTSFCLGHVVLTSCRRCSSARAGDCLFLMIWTGLAVTGVMLLWVSLVKPLGPEDLLIVTVGASLAALVRASFRRYLAILLSGITWGLIASLFALAVIAAWLSLEVVSNRDAVQYQYDIIHWLSREGTIPGIALIHERLGYASSWFTLPATLNHGPFTYRTGTVSSGFALYLALCQLQLTVLRVLRGGGRAIEWFMAGGLVFILVPSLLLNYPVSPSPDFAVAMMVLVVTWTMLITRDMDREVRESPRGRLIAIILAAAAVTMKITALPLFTAALVWYIYGSRPKTRALMLGGAVVTCILFPFLLAVTMASGCPLLPLPLCFDLPWTVSRSRISVADFFRVTREAYSVDFSNIRENLLAAGGLALAVGLNIWLLSRYRYSLRRIWPPFTTGFIGVAVFLVLGFQMRFLLGYLAVIVFSFFFIIDRRLLTVTKGIPVRNPSDLALSLAAALILAVLPGSLFRTRSEKRIAQAAAEGRIILRDEYVVLVPPEIPKVEYDDLRGIAFQSQGEKSQAGGSGAYERGVFFALQENETIDLRSPQRGVGAGFRRRGAR